LTLRELLWMARGKAELLGMTQSPKRQPTSVPYSPAVLEQLQAKMDAMRGA
jgi:hypothetical protein